MGAWHALGAYLLITLAATWPLAAGLGRDVAGALGDSILNMWILAWDCEQILAILDGDLSRIGRFFDANIFYPAPLTLAYSEHLIPQAIQILPIYASSANPILCYNLLFLSTFVLSGLGMYLLVRELTGNAAAAFVAGLVFAFVPYRFAQSSHLQVLSSQWMPFALYALRRHFDTGRLRSLVGAAGALVLQNLSCGYYLLYFSPFVVAFALWEINRRGLWLDRTTWLRLSGAAALVALVTLPFLVPYAELRSEWGAPRARAEILRFAADVYAYGTAFSEQPFWGNVLRPYPKDEGELFPGAVPIFLAIIGVAAAVARRKGAPDNLREAPLGRPVMGRQIAVALCAFAAIAYVTALVAALFLRRIVLDLWIFRVSISNVNRLLIGGVAALVLLLLLSPAVRSRAASFTFNAGFFAVALIAAAWLSLGLEPRSLGRPLDLVSPYALLVEHVPGFDGARAPARFGMIVMCMLAVLAGFGAAAFGRSRRARIVLAVACIVFLAEATPVPFTVNRMTPLQELNTPEARLYRPARAPVVYREVVRQAPDAVIAELPLGTPDYDLRAMYYSIAHWRPLLNGYSGFFPAHYGQLTAALTELPRHPALSLEVLHASGATHAIVHEAAFKGDEGPATSSALRQLGATELYRDGPDVLLALPSPP